MTWTEYTAKDQRLIFCFTLSLVKWTFIIFPIQHNITKWVTFSSDSNLISNSAQAKQCWWTSSEKPNDWWQDKCSSLTLDYYIVLLTAVFRLHSCVNTVHKMTTDPTDHPLAEWPSLKHTVLECTTNRHNNPQPQSMQLKCYLKATHRSSAYSRMLCLHIRDITPEEI